MGTPSLAGLVAILACTVAAVEELLRQCSARWLGAMPSCAGGFDRLRCPNGLSFNAHKRAGRNQSRK